MRTRHPIRVPDSMPAISSPALDVKRFASIPLSGLAQESTVVRRGSMRRGATGTALGAAPLESPNDSVASDTSAQSNGLRQLLKFEAKTVLQPS